MFEPRIGITWRPIPASTVVIKAGYGLYPDTSVYQNVILNMAQQFPTSTSINVSNTTCPLTLANGFPQTCASDNFGIDPNFRIGYAQNWQLSVQRDLPFALQITATYIGIKGTHGPQEILPNSYPLGESKPSCTGPNTSPDTSCPSGFVYETSGGNSIREAGQFQLRRRLRSGFAATLSYTFAKSIDDDAYLGGAGHTTRVEWRLGAVGVVVLSQCGDCAGLARSAGRALALRFRSAPTRELTGAIHQRAGAWRRHVAGWLARTGAEGVDGHGRPDLRHWVARDANLSSARSGHRILQYSAA